MDEIALSTEESMLLDSIRHAGLAAYKATLYERFREMFSPEELEETLQRFLSLGLIRTVGGDTNWVRASYKKQILDEIGAKNGRLDIGDIVAILRARVDAHPEVVRYEVISLLGDKTLETDSGLGLVLPLGTSS